jgi:sulfiredoxin
MKDQIFQIADIYVPTARRQTIDPPTVQALAESILEQGQTDPIMVRTDGKRFILVEGLQRLEACRLLGEKTIIGILVQAKRR